jgi:hypothetical protein
VSQFLIKLGELNVMPQIIRSDRGVEVDMMVDAFFTLQRDVEGPQLNLNECYYFGKSTKNVRIESWWRQLIMRQTKPWIVSMWASLGRQLLY